MYINKYVYIYIYVYNIYIYIYYIILYYIILYYIILYYIVLCYIILYSIILYYIILYYIILYYIIYIDVCIFIRSVVFYSWRHGTGQRQAAPPTGSPCPAFPVPAARSHGGGGNLKSSGLKERARIANPRILRVRSTLAGSPRGEKRAEHSRPDGDERPISFSGIRAVRPDAAWNPPRTNLKLHLQLCTHFHVPTPCLKPSTRRPATKIRLQRCTKVGRGLVHPRTLSLGTVQQWARCGRKSQTRPAEMSSGKSYRTLGPRHREAQQQSLPLSIHALQL